MQDPQIRDTTACSCRKGARRPHPVYWVIAGALLVIAVKLLFPSSGPRLSESAFAQPVMSGGTRGVFAFSGQLTPSSFGVHVVDVDTNTIWTYEYSPKQACLRLAAARSWKYDRYLENHNLCDLPPDVVEEMVEQQRRFKLQDAEEDMP